EGHPARVRADAGGFLLRCAAVQGLGWSAVVNRARGGTTPRTVAEADDRPARGSIPVAHYRESVGTSSPAHIERSRQVEFRSLLGERTTVVGTDLGLSRTLRPSGGRGSVFRGRAQPAPSVRRRGRAGGQVHSCTRRDR